MCTNVNSNKSLGEKIPTLSPSRIFTEPKQGVNLVKRFLTKRPNVHSSFNFFTYSLYISKRLSNWFKPLKNWHYEQVPCEIDSEWHKLIYFGRNNVLFPKPNFYNLWKGRQIPDLCLAELSREKEVANLGWDSILQMARLPNRRNLENGRLTNSNTILFSEFLVAPT